MIDILFVASMIAILIVVAYELGAYISRKRSSKSPKVITARDIIAMKEKENNLK